MDILLLQPVIYIKKIKNIDIIAGNVATKEGVEYLAKAKLMVLK